MDDLATAGTWAQAAAALLAGAAALRWRSFRGIAFLFGVAGVASDAVRCALWTRVIEPTIAPFLAAKVQAPPLTGWIRVAGHLDQALFLLWPAGMAAVAIGVFMGRRRAARVVGAILWTLSSAAFAALYPWLRGARLADAHQLVHGVCLSVALYAVVFWVVRNVIPRLRRRAMPRAAEVVMAVALALDALVVANAYAPQLLDGWPVAQAIQLMMYTIATLILLGVLTWSIGSKLRAPSLS